MIASSRALLRTLVPLSGILLVAIIVALATGYQSIRWSELGSDETTRTIFFQLRAPRVFLGVLVGGSLAGVGAALQALFRNPDGGALLGFRATVLGHLELTAEAKAALDASKESLPKIGSSLCTTFTSLFSFKIFFNIE